MHEYQESSYAVGGWNMEVEKDENVFSWFIKYLGLETTATVFSNKNVSGRKKGCMSNLSVFETGEWSFCCCSVIFLER